MSLSTPSAGHAPGLPPTMNLDTTPRALRPPRPIADVYSDALRLAELLHLVRHYDPMTSRDKGGVDAGVDLAAELAETLADDLEAML